MIAVFQEAQLKSNRIEEVILYTDNLQPRAFISTGGEVVRFNLNYDFDDRKEGISFFRLQTNINSYLLDQKIAKATTNLLKFCLKPPQYLLCTWYRLLYQYQIIIIVHSSEEVNLIKNYFL